MSLRRFVVAVALFMSTATVLAQPLSAAEMTAALDRSDALVIAGKCAEAEGDANQTFSNQPSWRLTLLGMIADHCRHDKKLAASLMTESARYGHPFAVDYLEKAKLPVPPEDKRQ